MQGVYPGPRRDQPWPTDVIINSVGYMLGVSDPRSGAKLVGTLVKTMPLFYEIRAEFNYGLLDVTEEATFDWTKLTGGYGHRYAHGAKDDHTYYWALGMDCSIGGQIQNGPLISSATPGTVDATNGGTPDGFFEMTGSIGAKTLLLLNGRYCQVRAGASGVGTYAAPSKDFGVGKASLDVIVHTQNTGSGGTTLAYVAMGDGEHMWKYDAASTTTTWTQHATLDALCFAKNGKHLYRAATTNLISRVDTNADPWVAGNWSAANSFRVGDATSPIRKMRVHPDGTLYVLKTDGLYVLLDDGTDLQLYSALKFTPNADNGLYSFLYENWLHVTMAGSHYRISPGGTIQPIGPERAVENDSDVRGYVTAGVGTPWGPVASIYNPDSGNSYLLKYGSFDVGDDGIDHWTEAWHGSICDRLASQKIKAMFRTSVGAPTNHEQVFFVNDVGVISSYILNCVPNPKGCSQYLYTAGANGSGSGSVSHLYTPHFSGNFPIDNKGIRWAAFTVRPSPGAVSMYAYLNDAMTPATTGLATGTNVVLASAATAPGSKTEQTPSVGINVAWEITMATPGTNLTTVLTSFGFGYQLRPRVALTYEVLVLAEDGLMRNDGSPLGIGAQKIRTNLLGFATTASTQTICLEGVSTIGGTTNTFQDMSCIGYEETFAWNRRAEKWQAAIKLTMMQGQPEVVNYGQATRSLGA